MAPTERDTTVTVRMSKDERAMLEALAESVGLSASDIIRQLVRAAHAEKFPPKKRGR
jgi:Arc/MetJ-type ribon-helix-helix transcriptional regulator